MKKRIYKAVKGARFSDEDAQIIGGVLEKLPEVTPEAVVTAAQPKRSPLHGYFQWDDTEAARLYREDQARYLVRHINIVIVADDEEVELRAFHHVTIKTQEEGEESESFYASVEHVMADPDFASQVVNRALRELVGWKARYKAYREIFGPVFEAIEEVKKRKTA